LKPFYDIKSFIKRPEIIHYFYSRNSKWDFDQYRHINTLPMNIYHFKTSHHGIPFIKSTLPKLLNTNIENLSAFLNAKLNPILFSIRIGGPILTFKGLWVIAKTTIFKN